MGLYQDFLTEKVGRLAVRKLIDLAGQHFDYLKLALEEYKSGDRKDPTMAMAGMSAALTEEDIVNVAAHYAAQEHLQTLDGQR